MSLPAPGGGRTTAKTAARGGAVASTTGTTKPTTPGTTTQPTKSASFPAFYGADGVLANPKYQATANLAQQPNTTIHGIVAATIPLGSLVPYQFPGTSLSDEMKNLKTGGLGFRFHYNPSTVTVSNPTGMNYNPPQLDVSTPIVPGLSTVSFDVLINRSEDIYDRRALPEPMLGLNTFDQIGTQYDIEWLFRTINGLVTDGNGNTNGLLTSDIGMLVPNPVALQLGEALNWVGYISDMSYKHIQFSYSNMVPMYTILSLTLTRWINTQTAYDNSGASSDF